MLHSTSICYPMVNESKFQLERSSVNGSFKPVLTSEVGVGWEMGDSVWVEFVSSRVVDLWGSRQDYWKCDVHVLSLGC